MDFLLFLGVNAALFIRPAELLPSLAAWPIYNIIIVANLILCAPGVLRRLHYGELQRSPSTLCMLGLLVAVTLSHVAWFNVPSALDLAVEFAKIVAYFLLLLTVLHSTARLRWFLCALVIFTATSTGIAILDFHGLIQVPSIRHVEEYYVYRTPAGELLEESIPRLGATGIIGDPNDLALVIVSAMTITVGYVLFTGFSIEKLALLPILGLLGYGLALTHSRGGLMALVCSMLALFYSRYGIRRALWLWIPTTLLLAAVFAGRQTDFSQGLEGGSGQERAGLWSDWFQEGFRHPLFGVGARRGADVINGRAAHNSFVHIFSETGIVGAVFFCGLIYLSLTSLHRIGKYRKLITSPRLAALQPTVFAMLVSYSVCMLALSRCYDVTTYMFAGLATCYGELTAKVSPIQPRVASGELAIRVVQATLGLLLMCYCLMRFAR